MAGVHFTEVMGFLNVNFYKLPDLYRICYKFRFFFQCCLTGLLDIKSIYFSSAKTSFHIHYVINFRVATFINKNINELATQT